MSSRGCLWQEWQALGVEQLRLSTVDLSGAPSLEQLQRGVEFLLRHRERGNSVYVHCKAGRSRSATMVAAYLIQVRRVLVVRARTASLYSLVLLKSPEVRCHPVTVWGLGWARISGEVHGQAPSSQRSLFRGAWQTQDKSTSEAYVD